MLTILASTGRVLFAHWPVMLAWFLTGTLGHYLALELAGFVGGWSATGGMLLLPLAVLARLIGFVAMFLVVRDGLRNLSAIAPLPTDRAQRRREFLDALLASILPFFAVYTASGFLDDDLQEYAQRSLEVSMRFGQPGVNEVGVLLSVNVFTVAIIVLAFAARGALKRYSERLPRWFAVIAVYLEAVWIAFSLFLIRGVIGQFTSWVDNRVGKVWLDDVAAWFDQWLVPFAWVWNGILWVLGEAGSVVLPALAWLAIAGVLYGQVVAPAAVNVQDRVASVRAVKVAQERWAKIPEALRRRIKDLADDVIGRFRPIGRAIVLMWRAGPVMIATYALLYVALQAAESLIGFGITRLIGPQDFASFWLVADQVIFMAVPFLIEPVRVALVAGSYDATLGALRAPAERV